MNTGVTETTAGRLLVVDDDEQALRFLVELLQMEGYVIDAVADGAAAWSLLEMSGPEYAAVITDRRMPRMDGMQLLTRIKGDTRLRDLPVIFQTGLASEDDVVEGIRAGVHHYLTKPYKPRRLLSVVAAAVADGVRHRDLRQEVNAQASAMALIDNGTFRCRTLDQTRALACLVANACPRPQAAVTGLSELLLNAVEHGNLGISYEEKSELLGSGRWIEEVERRLALPEQMRRSVVLQLERTADSVRITIRDQGTGFEPARYLDFDPLRATDAHGRGIALARLMSFDALEYIGCGNEVVATMRFDDDGHA